MKDYRAIKCPTCYTTVWLQPEDNGTYEAEYRKTATAHEKRGCAHHGYGSWEYDPAWDKPREPRWLKHGHKRLIEDKSKGVYRMDSKVGE